MDDTKTLEDMSEPCPHDICDGSGFLETGAFDDIEEKECLCRKERKLEESANS